MVDALRRSLVARSTAIIVAIVGAVGLFFLVLAVPLAMERESARQLDQLNELLDTVEHPARIACYLGDRQLAGEVASGLLGNRTVREVVVSAGGVDLARRAKPAPGMPPAPPPLIRRLASPFNADETVGEIALVPDEAQMRTAEARAWWFTVAMLGTLLVFTGLGVVVVVARLITGPIARISDHVHTLAAEAGQKLAVPRGNEADEIGRLVRDVNAMVDRLVDVLSAERRLRRKREIDEKRFRAIFEHAETAIFVLDAAGAFVSHNPASSRVLGLPAEGRLPGFAALLGDRASELLAKAGRGASAEADVELAGRPGAPSRWISVVLSPAEEGRLQGVANDITERKLAEQAAQALAATDALTGLGNRLGLERRLRQTMDECYRAPGRAAALLMLDLDRFKQVNDTYGHAAGDRVLLHVARALTGAIRKSDFAGRVGGDEFVLLLEPALRRDIVERIARSVIEAVIRPVALEGGKSASVGASVGIAVFNGVEAMEKDELIRQADEAMYAAKKAGGNAYRFYGRAMAHPREKEPA